MESESRTPLANRTNQITNSSIKREIDKDFVNALENFDYQQFVSDPVREVAKPTKAYR